MEKNPEDKTFAELFYDLSEEEQDSLIAMVDEFGSVESIATEDWGDDLEPDEDRWGPSCEMDCELCGCHGDCPDCGTEGEYDEDDLDD